MPNTCTDLARQAAGATAPARAQITHYGRVGRSTRIGCTGCLKCAECGLAGVALVLTAAAFSKASDLQVLVQDAVLACLDPRDDPAAGGFFQGPPACLHPGLSQLGRSTGTAGSLLATVTAAGFRRSGSGWALIAVKRIGKANGWFWFPVQTCSLTTTQLKNSTSPAVVRFDSIKVSLLITPAIGCSGTFSERWTP